MTPRTPLWLAPPLLALALLVLAVPPAQACSLAGPVPGPGMFELRPVDSASPPVRIEVEGRILGAMCDLSNPHALGGGWFAWFEHDMAGGPWSLHARDLATGEGVKLENVTQRRVLEMGTDGMRVYWYEHGFAEADGTRDHAFMSFDLATRNLTRLDLPRLHYADVAIDGSLVAATSRAIWNESGGINLSAYDAREAR